MNIPFIDERAVFDGKRGFDGAMAAPSLVMVLVIMLSLLLLLDLSPFPSSALSDVDHVKNLDPMDRLRNCEGRVSYVGR